MKTINKQSLKRPALWRLLIQKRTFFIKPKFQVRFILYVMSWTLAALAIFYISQQFFFHQFYTSGEELGLSQDHPYFQLLKDQQSGLSKIFFITAGFISFLILFSALFFSHRIAGPLYRLEKFFSEESKSNEFNSVKLAFRKDDFFQELPNVVNEFIESRVTKNKSED